MSGAGESAAAKATSVPCATHKVCWGVVPRSAGHLVHDTKDTKSTFWHHPADAGTRPLRSRKGHTSSRFVRPARTEPTPTPPILAINFGWHRAHRTGPTLTRLKCKNMAANLGLVPPTNGAMAIMCLFELFRSCYGSDTIHSHQIHNNPSLNRFWLV